MAWPAAALPAILPVLLFSAVGLLAKQKHSSSYYSLAFVVFNVLPFFIFVISSVSSPSSSTTDGSACVSASSSMCCPEKDAEARGIVREETSSATDNKYETLDDELQASCQIPVEDDEKKETSTATSIKYDLDDEVQVSCQILDGDIGSDGKEEDDDDDDDLERRSDDFICKIREKWKNELQLEVEEPSVS